MTEPPPVSPEECSGMSTPQPAQPGLPDDTAAAGAHDPTASAVANPVHVVGIGMGADDVTGTGRDVLAAADVVVGSARQWHAIHHLAPHAQWLRLPTQVREELAEILGHHTDRRVVVLASGDPLWHGIGSTTLDVWGIDRVRVVPGVSSVAAVCARQGWALQRTAVVSLVTGDLESAVGECVMALEAGRHVVVLGRDGESPRALGQQLTARGFGHADVVVWTELARATPGTDSPTWSGLAQDAAAVGEPVRWGRLNAIAVTGGNVSDEPGGGVSGWKPTHSRAPGLPDGAFEHDGQLTKREVRAVTLAYLRPAPSLLLWDVGAGAGSVAIEWLRAAPDACAVALERNEARAETIRRNAAALGVSGLTVVQGDQTRLGELPDPDVVFIGGGVTAPGVLDQVWARLPVGGRVVVNAVTVEATDVVRAWRRRVGGDLVTVAVSHADVVGRFEVMRPTLPVTVWHAMKTVGES